MKKTKGMMLPLLGLGLIVSAGTAQAVENAVLFKIHDIVPVKNADGLVVSCDLGATFYNRSDTTIENATLNLVWHDDVVSETIDQEQRNERESRRLKKTTVSRYRTSDINDKDIRMSLKLPTLRKNQQLSLKSKVTTDRCFLLLNEMDVNVTNCRASTASENKNDRSGRVGESCQNLFRYVSVNNPEYYSEFREISNEDMQNEERSKIEQQKQNLQELYNESLNEINKVSTNLTYESFAE